MKALRVPFAAGCLVGGLFVAALLLLDVGGLGTLIARDQAALLPILMLVLAFVALFGVAVAASSFADRQPLHGHRRQIMPLAVRASSATRRLRSPNR